MPSPISRAFTRQTSITSSIDSALSPSPTWPTDGSVCSDSESPYFRLAARSSAPTSPLGLPELRFPITIPLRPAHNATPAPFTTEESVPLQTTTLRLPAPVRPELDSTLSISKANVTGRSRSGDSQSSGHAAYSAMTECFASLSSSREAKTTQPRRSPRSRPTLLEGEGARDDIDVFMELQRRMFRGD